MRIFCTDLSNTHTRGAVIENQKIIWQDAVSTKSIEKRIPTWESQLSNLSVSSVALASVVPLKNDIIYQLADYKGIPLFHLTSENCPIPLDYPQPSEIGQDRLANAVAAAYMIQANTIIIDLGTATNFDVYHHPKGYAGGIIAPGLALMTEYLHQKTALLPKLDPQNLDTEEILGKSTLEALKVGCDYGYAGMIQNLLDRLLKNAEESDQQFPSIVATGGYSQWIQKRIRPIPKVIPDLTLQGIYLAATKQINKEDLDFQDTEEP